MTRYIFATLGVVIAGVAGAQTPSPSQPATAPPKADAAITVSGCLKPWTGMGIGTTPAPTPAPATPSATASFILTDVEQKDAPAAMPTPAAGEAGAAMAHAAPREQYLLQAATGVNLAPHVNHQIEVTGRIVSMAMNSAATPPPSATPETAGTPGTPGTPGRPAPGMTREDGHKTAPQTLSVSAVKMISATCK